MTGAAATATDSGSGSAGGVIVVDVIRPKSRYLFPDVTISGGNVVIQACVAIRYRARAVPVTQDSTVLAQALSTPEV